MYSKERGSRPGTTVAAAGREDNCVIPKDKRVGVKKKPWTETSSKPSRRQIDEDVEDDGMLMLAWRVGLESLCCVLRVLCLCRYYILRDSTQQLLQ